MGKEVLAVAEAALSLDPQRVAEISLVDLAHLILKTTNKTFLFRDLMTEVARIKGLTEEQVNEVIARVYTEINIDGRFVCIGNNVWGLKRWYPTDKGTAETKASGKKFVRKDIDEDDDFYDDEDEDAYVEDEEDEEPFAAAYGDDADDEDKAEEDFDDEPVEDEEIAEEETEDEEDLDAYDEDDDF